jgi:YidC/Oxa1 family membrane protein insertase
MNIFSSLWNGLKDGLEGILRAYEGLLEPVAGQYAWGLSIILLTVTVRVLLIPLMVRQTKSMRATQRLQPELKRIREKYKADGAMRKTDPERYRKLKEKEREAQMALYQEHQVNPVGGCLPLLLQMPVFFALFQVLTESDRLTEFARAPWLGVDSLSTRASEGFAIGAVALVVLQAATTYWSTRQMQARTTAAAAPEQAQAQKLMLYVMPAFLAYLSFTFPVGVVLYWVTTNVWTIGQQHVIFKQVEAAEARDAEARKAARAAKRTGASGQPDGGGGEEPAPEVAAVDPVREATTKGTARADGAASGRAKGTNGSSPRGGRSSKGPTSSRPGGGARRR